MRTLPDSLKASLATGCTTLCHCWRLERVDGVTFGFTDHDRSLSFDGQSFEPVAGFEASEASSSVGFGVSGLEILGAIDSDRLSDGDLAAGLFDNARIEQFLVDWMDTDSRLRLRVGNLGDVIRSDHGFRAEIRGAMQHLDQVQGRRFTKACDAIVGDGRCGVMLDTPVYASEATVSRVIDDLNAELSGLDAYDDGWFSRGSIHFIDGANDGQRRAVSFHAREEGRTRLSLWQGPVMPWQVGDRVKVFAGCDNTLATCRSKFSNLLNYRGFPQIPGNDFVFGYASGRDRNDGGSLS
ncbi:DUF2163 domain-containing protein [Coralliovum pocilloporae]|uniref:DUF2163 domain-containing protein n=1 Tax=Coralliovum pocilloporae TaxID=3066369 RepID=UPI003307AB7D